jgi:hypothetical protein
MTPSGATTPGGSTNSSASSDGWLAPHRAYLCNADGEQLNWSRRRGGSLWVQWVMAVSTNPGAAELTRMPSSASFSARLLVSRLTGRRLRPEQDRIDVEPHGRRHLLGRDLQRGALGEDAHVVPPEVQLAELADRQVGHRFVVEQVRPRTTSALGRPPRRPSPAPAPARRAPAWQSRRCPRR